MKSMLDRKLLLLVLSPIARAILSLLVGYLSAKGLPPDLIEQAAAAIGAFAVVGFNICWELIDRKKAENRGARRALDELSLPRSFP